MAFLHTFANGWPMADMLLRKLLIHAGPSKIDIAQEYTCSNLWTDIFWNPVLNWKWLSQCHFESISAIYRRGNGARARGPRGGKSKPNQALAVEMGLDEEEDDLEASQASSVSSPNTTKVVNAYVSY